MINRNEKYNVGAIIVNFGLLQNLKPCIDAIKNQEFPFHKVIIVDNNVKNNNDKLIDTLTDEFQYIKLEYNSGFAKANNIAVKYLESCEWIALINPDAYLHPGWLKTLKETVSNYPEYAIFGRDL